MNYHHSKERIISHACVNATIIYELMLELSYVMSATTNNLLNQ